MTISVLIPTYNSGAFVSATIDSVVRQTIKPHEILVLDDGSTDDTLEKLSRYSPGVTVLAGTHQGAAAARNTLCERASGELLAFLDSDDLWYPQYLEIQRRSALAKPDAAIYITGHDTVIQGEDFKPKLDLVRRDLSGEIIQPPEFMQQYSKATGAFGMGFCCAPKRLLGREPFRCSGAEDSYFIYSLLLRGSVVYTREKLGAVTIRSGSLSDNRLTTYGALVRVFEELQESYIAQPDEKLRKVYWRAAASARRTCAKHLLGVGDVRNAKRHLSLAAVETAGTASFCKSMGLLFATFLPRSLQPTWPLTRRWDSNSVENYQDAG